MSIEQLIEELEALRARLHVRALSPAEYQCVGWADRPLRQLIDQCREEQEAQSWADKHAREFAPIRGTDLGTEIVLELLPEPIPLRTLIADGAGPETREASP